METGMLNDDRYSVKAPPGGTYNSTDVYSDEDVYELHTDSVSTESQAQHSGLEETSPPSARDTKPPATTAGICDQLYAVSQVKRRTKRR